jgi:hypothetical protein
VRDPPLGRSALARWLAEPVRLVSSALPDPLSHRLALIGHIDPDQADALLLELHEVAALDPADGSVIWSKVPTGNTFDGNALAIGALASGDVVTTGYLGDDDGYGCPGCGYPDLMAIRHSAIDGSEVWRARQHDAANEWRGLAITPDDDVVVGGNLSDQDTLVAGAAVIKVRGSDGFFATSTTTTTTTTSTSTTSTPSTTLPGIASKCVGTKLKAIGKKESGLLGCQARVAGTGDSSGLSACEDKVKLKFSTTFGKAGTCNGDEMTC